MNIIALVLYVNDKNPKYTPDAVYNIVRQIRNHTNCECEIVCLTNKPTAIMREVVDRIIPFKHNFPKWWGKIELFNPTNFEIGDNITFFDLDTFIVNDITDIIDYKMLSNFMCLKDVNNASLVGSGIMKWSNGTHENIYTRFIENNHYEKVIPNLHGDQDWISNVVRRPTYIQQIFPDRIYSYKTHCKRVGSNGIIPRGASIIFFHGNPPMDKTHDETFMPYWNPYMDINPKKPEN